MVISVGVLCLLSDDFNLNLHCKATTSNIVMMTMLSILKAISINWKKHQPLLDLNSNVKSLYVIALCCDKYWILELGS